MNPTKLFLPLFVVAAAAYGQTDKITTDRPDQTESPTLVPIGWIQVETGASIERITVGNTKVKDITFNTSLVKFGLTKQFELRLIQEYAGREGVSETQTGFGPLALGAKIFLAEEKGAWPAVSLIGHVHTRTGSRGYRPSFVAPDLRFVFAHTLSDKFSLSYNFGGEWNGEEAASTMIYTISLGISLTEKLACFIESYGFLPEYASQDHRVDAGFTYLINDNLQLDISSGLGLSPNSPDNFLSGGVSWRFNTRK